MREMKAAIKLWNRGDYMGAYLRPTRDRARRRSRRAGGTTGVDQVVARAIRYAQEGRISKALHALEAAQLAPATDRTLRDIIALHPPRFVPTECPRRAAVTQQVAAARRTHGWKKLQWKHFHKAMQTMPRSAATWTPTGMLRHMARTKVGLTGMHWVMEQIINAAAPRDV